VYWRRLLGVRLFFQTLRNWAVKLISLAQNAQNGDHIHEFTNPQERI